MLSHSRLKQFAVDFHTDERNVIREYYQHLLLSYLYIHKKSNKLAFKGGTALRILFKSPRFSEDLDFSSDINEYHIRQMLEETLLLVEKEGIAWSTGESKTTSGGYFARYLFAGYNQTLSIEFNISFRDNITPEAILVGSPFIPAYQCMTLPVNRLVWEKVDALLRRKKPRDFFDLYFLLRERRGMEEILKQKKRLIPLVQSLDGQRVKEELRLFLPQTQHALLRDFPKLLLNELDRF